VSAVKKKEFNESIRQKCYTASFHKQNERVIEQDYNTVVTVRVTLTSAAVV